jgi:hypothetical protein
MYSSGCSTTASRSPTGVSLPIYTHTHTYDAKFIYIIYAHRIRTVECSDERMLNESMPEHVHHLLRVYLLYCYTLLHLRGVCAFVARCVYLLFSALLHLLYCYTLLLYFTAPAWGLCVRCALLLSALLCLTAHLLCTVLCSTGPLYCTDACTYA